MFLFRLPQHLIRNMRVRGTFSSCPHEERSHLMATDNRNQNDKHNQGEKHNPNEHRQMPGQSGQDKLGQDRSRDADKNQQYPGQQGQGSKQAPKR